MLVSSIRHHIGTPAISLQRKCSQLIIGKAWNQAIEHCKRVPNQYRIESLYTKEVAFFDKNQIDKQFPSYLKAQEETLGLIQNDIAYGTVYHSDEYETIRPDGRSNTGRLSLVIPLTSSELDESTRRFQKNCPHIFNLCLESGVRLAHFLDIPEKTVKTIITRILIYNVYWQNLSNPLHADGSPAIQIPLYSENCLGETSFYYYSAQGEKRKESGNDIPVVTTNLEHVAFIKKINDKESARRVVVNTMLITH